MKRLFCIIGSLLICTSSVFAWNAESFLSDGSAEYQPYSLDPVEDPAPDLAQVPMLMSLDGGVSVAAETDSSSVITVRDFWNSLPSLYMGISYRYQELNFPYPDFGYISKLASTGSSGTAPGGDFSLVRQYYVNDLLVPSFSDVEEVRLVAPVFSYSGFSEGIGDTTFSVSLPVSDLNGATSISFDSNLAIKSIVTSVGEIGGGVVVVRVNGSIVRTLYPVSYQNGFAVFDLSSVQYISTLPIQSIVLEFQSLTDSSFQLTPSYEGSKTYGLRFLMSFDVDSYDDSLVSGLIIPPGLDGENDKVQGDLDIHHSIESEWTGSMTENFNALDLSGFTFPGGLVAAMALITGIFNDLWNGMGDYKILYVFPLTLGVVLLLIGRISKFSGRSSSGRGGKGDDSA